MNYKKYCFSILVNSLLMLYFLALFYCRFETNDDFFMKMIVSGIYGNPDSHIVFINSIIGFVLKSLYTVVPSIPWYDILQFFIILLSLSTIAYVLINSNTNYFSAIFTYVVLFVSAHFLYVNLQFTKTTTIITVAGYMLLRYAIENNKKNIVAFSVAMLCVAMLFRRNQFLMTSAICAPLFISYFFIFSKDKNNQINIEIIRRLLIAAITCVLFFIVTKRIDLNNYSSPEWKAYRVYNSARAALLDRETIVYDKSIKDYNLSEIDYEMLKLWNFDDPEVFDIKTIKIILEHQTKKAEDIIVLLKGFINNAISFFYNNKDARVYSILLFILAIQQLLSKKDKSKLISILLSLIISTFSIFYTYLYRNHVFIERVHISVVMTMVFILLYYAEFNEYFGTCFIKYACGILVTIFLSFFWFDDFRVNCSKREKDCKKIDAIRIINEDLDHLYLRSTDENIDFITTLFLDNDLYSKGNIYSLGGWTVNMPLNDNIKRKYNVDNIFKDVINNEKVYLLVSDEKKLQTILKYINEHYDDKARLLLVRKINANKEYGVYKVVSKREGELQ